MGDAMGKLAGLAATPRLKRGAGAARAMWRAALDLALPRLCAACREPVEGQGLCPACWSKLSFITRPYCERLGIPFVYDPGPGILSMEAIADPPAYHGARAAVRFDEISRALVHALKYGDRLDLAPMMGRWIGQAGRELLAEADALVPVPLHWRRRWARRFNQSGHAGSRRLRHQRRAYCRRGAQARQGDHVTGGAVAVRTRRQRPGRIPRPAGRKAGDGRPPPRPGRRRADVGRYRRGLHQGAPPRGRC
jgi:predicted amidophosphoribosyltransferase